MCDLLKCGLWDLKFYAFENFPTNSKLGVCPITSQYLGAWISSWRLLNIVEKYTLI